MRSGESRLRVALDGHTIGRRAGGNETYALTLAAGLAQRADVDLTVWLDRGVAWPAAGAATMRTDTVAGASRLRVRRFATRRPQLRIPLEVPLRAATNRADVVHVQYVGPPVGRVPVVTTVHDLSFLDAPDVLRRSTRWRLRSLVRLAVRSSRAVIVPSEFTRDRLLHHYDLDPGSVFVTPLALPSRLRTADNLLPGTRLAALGVVPPYVLHVGRPEPRKNVARLVSAVATARRQGADVRLVLAGSAVAGAPDVQAAVDRHHAEAWTLGLGYVSDADLDALYAGAAVVAYPSLYEGFGLPVLEAMAAGVPVVTSDVSSMPEVAGDAALLVDPTSVDALAQALIAVLCDPDVHARHAEAGRARAQVFSIRRLADQTIAAYRHAIG